MLCTKDRADKVINGTADKLILEQIKKNNLLNEIINFNITNIQDYMTKETCKPLQQLDKVVFY